MYLASMWPLTSRILKPMLDQSVSVCQSGKLADGDCESIPMLVVGGGGNEEVMVPVRGRRGTTTREFGGVECAEWMKIASEDHVLMRDRHRLPRLYSNVSSGVARRDRPTARQCSISCPSLVPPSPCFCPCFPWSPPLAVSTPHTQQSPPLPNMAHHTLSKRAVYIFISLASFLAVMAIFTMRNQQQGVRDPFYAVDIDNVRHSAQAAALIHKPGYAIAPKLGNETAKYASRLISGMRED